jgi:putative ABC transport system ATP-binding protein
MNLIELHGLAKTYPTGDTLVHALRPADITIEEGLFIAVMGPSGSGKSTLLNLIGLLDRATAGAYILHGENVAGLTDDAMADIRCRRIGMIFQSFNLFPRFTVLENVCVPMQYADADTHVMQERATKLLDTVGLSHRIHHKPTQLSGGECQRTAIARALANDPSIILADEPTGNLDERTGNEIMDIFRGLVRQGKTVIMVTHNPEYAKCVERVISLRDGEVVDS